MSENPGAPGTQGTQPAMAGGTHGTHAVPFWTRFLLAEMPKPDDPW
jgi:hypothetical protein